MPIAAALIDLDGTLCDSAPELAAAVDRVLVDAGHDRAGVDHVRDWVGDGIDRLVERALAHATGESPDAEALRHARGRFDTAYAEILGTMAPLYPGVVEGLDGIRSAGIATACITNKAGVFAIGLLGSLGIADRFDTIISGDRAAERKPAAAPLEMAARKLGVAIDDCVMVGDSAIDIAAARAAGCPVWCVRTGYNRGAPLEDSAPDRIFDRFDELAAALIAGTG
ncbi:MAG: phosphoglycolate phosphatase [Halofilum sp. (in: g-proteobacteria)]|nr:phosphoglycolate phosphatase [Halofilum sp. (in: g-proteobacteria)]